jgi:hypothetical protein
MRELAKSAAATLVAYPRRNASVASATVRFQTPSTSLTDAAAATVEDLSLLTTVAASVGDTTLTVDDFAEAGAPVIGRQYLIVERGQEALRVECADFNATANTILLAQPLPRDLAVGAEVQGFALTTSLTSTHTETKGEGSAEWTVTVNEADGLTQTVEPPFTTAFRIVERSSHYALTWSLLGRWAPDLQHEKPANDVTGDETLDAAWQMHVVPALAQRNILPGRIINQDLLRPVHVAAVRFLLFPESEVAQREFYEKVNQAMASRGWWYDEEETLAPPDDTAQPRRMRLTR